MTTRMKMRLWGAGFVTLLVLAGSAAIAGDKTGTDKANASVKSGIQTESWHNGKKKSEYRLVNGKIHGKRVWYYETGDKTFPS